MGSSGSVETAITYEIAPAKKGWQLLSNGHAVSEDVFTKKKLAFDKAVELMSGSGVVCRLVTRKKNGSIQDIRFFFSPGRDVSN